MSAPPVSEPPAPDAAARTDITCSRGLAGWLVTYDVSFFTSARPGSRVASCG